MNLFIGILLHVLAVCKLSPGNPSIIQISTDHAVLDVLWKLVSKFYKSVCINSLKQFII
jgi:hypothetical protein